MGEGQKVVYFFVHVIDDHLRLPRPVLATVDCEISTPPPFTALEPPQQARPASSRYS